MENTEENSEKIGKIWKNIVKWYGKYGRQASPIYFSSVFSKSFHYSTWVSSIFSKSFHYSTWVSSIISKSGGKGGGGGGKLL
jgi:hypothetical protein